MIATAAVDQARPGLARGVRLGLRARVTVGFGLLALALSAGLAGASWFLVSGYLLEQKEAVSVVQTSLSVEALELALSSDPGDIPASIDATPVNDRTSALLDYQGSWYTSSLTAGPHVLPTELVAMVGHGSAATQRILMGGQPYLVVGTPMATRGDSYYELFSLAELDRTDRTLSVVLVLAACVAAGLGLLLGRLASGRVLRPLAELNSAAAGVARGDLSIRLAAEQDPDVGELAASFNRTTAALERRVAADARFAADVSHELRTPLTTMLNSMAVLENREAELPESVLGPLHTLSDELQRFRRLVVDLLEISRDDVPARAEDMDEVAIGDVVRAAADGATGRNVTRVAGDVDGLRVPGDKRRLERIIVDLVENAELHGGGCERVDVRRGASHVLVTVDDAGPGIPAGNRDRVFERFAREPGSASDGSGLGLAIVSRHVRWHGGDVSLGERPGGGTRIVVRLPLRRQVTA